MAIIGAGTMGVGIAQVAASAGIRVCLLDVDEQSLGRSRQLLKLNISSAVQRGKLTEERAAELEGIIEWSLDYQSLRHADWVIEAVFEDREVKRNVLKRAAAFVAEGVPVATNTSTFTVKELAAFYGRGAYFLGMHFFNPAPAMKLVEVVPTEETLPEVTAAAIQLCERMGKTPRVVPDIPGFVVNRAFAALVAAAVEVWALGGEAETIDSAIEMGLGHKMGPLRTADLVGLDLMLAIERSLYEQTGHPRFQVPQAFVDMVESGKLGRKSGEGFYRYDR